MLQSARLLTMRVKRRRQPCTQTMRLLSGFDSDLMERGESRDPAFVLPIRPSGSFVHVLSGAYVAKPSRPDFFRYNFLNPFNLLAPSNPRAKIFHFRFTEIYAFLPTSRLHKRGVSRSSRTWEVGCGGRGGA
jgi:hypothetical protein